MALPLGKLTILIGAGIVGSVLVKDGRLPTASDLFSGAFKSVWKRLGTNDSSTPTAKPKSDAWLQQVNSLREEIQFYASNRSVTIVTSTSSGGHKYYIVVVIIVVGGYLWWKGWKLPDLRFATRRSLSDASANIEKKLQNVHTSIATTKKQVSVKLGDLDNKLDETHKNSEEAHKDVRELLRVDARSTGDRFQSVLDVVKQLESSIDLFEGKQIEMLFGIKSLVDSGRDRERHSRAGGQIEGSATRSSLPAVDLPQPTPSRVGSVSGNLSLEPAPPSPSTLNGSAQQQKQGAMPDSGLKLDLVRNGREGSSGSSVQPLKGSVITRRRSLNPSLTFST